MSGGESVDRLRQAAAQMQALAEAAAADGGASWRIGERGACRCCEQVVLANGSPLGFIDDRYAPHIAAMNPAVALAVADWLEAETADFGPGEGDGWISLRAVAVADTFLAAL